MTLFSGRDLGLVGHHEHIYSVGVYIKGAYMLQVSILHIYRISSMYTIYVCVTQRCMLQLSVGYISYMHI